MDRNGGTNIAWNVVWMAPSLTNLLIDWKVELLRTPIALLVYLAIKHFVEGLPMCISRQHLQEVFSKFVLVEDAISSAEVSLCLIIEDITDDQRHSFS